MTHRERIKAFLKFREEKKKAYDIISDDIISLHGRQIIISGYYRRGYGSGNLWYVNSVHPQYPREIKAFFNNNHFNSRRNAIRQARKLDKKIVLKMTED